MAALRSIGAPPQSGCWLKTTSTVQLHR